MPRSNHILSYVESTYISFVELVDLGKECG